MSIRTPLTILINKSFASGTVPNDVKIAKVVPLLKSRTSEECDNLRSISLLPVLSKLFEKIMYRRTVNFLEKHDLIYAKQFGFRKKHSTNDAILMLVGNVLEGLDNNNVAFSVFIDLRKAFDSVSHRVILGKLECMGIRGQALNWYKSYLQD